VKRLFSTLLAVSLELYKELETPPALFYQITDNQNTRAVVGGDREASDRRG